MDEKEAAPPPSNALQSQRIYDYSEPQLQNHKNPNFDQTLKFDQGYNNKTKIDRKNNPDRKTPDSINTDRINTERINTERKNRDNITDRINTDRINADRVFTNRRKSPTTTTTTEINHTDRLHNAKFLNTNSINKTDRINSDNNAAADQTVTLLGSSDLLGGTQQMHQASTRSTSSSASSASPQQLDQETYNNMETESVKHFNQMKKITELENSRNFTHKSHNLTPTKDSDQQTGGTETVCNFQDNSPRFEYEHSETVFTEVNNLQETHLVENYCESNGDLEPEDGLYEDYEYEIEYDARYRINSASRQTDTADLGLLNNPESVAVDEQFGGDEIMLGYEGEQIEMEEDYENNSLKTPSKENLSKSSRSTSVSSSTQASPMNLLQSHSPNLYNKSPSIKKSLNNQPSKSNSSAKSASQNSLQNSTSSTVSHSNPQQSNQSSSANNNNNNSTPQTTTQLSNSSNNTHHHFSIANSRKSSHPNISRMRTTPPPRKTHRKTSSNEIHRTPSLDALTGNFLKSRGIGAGWPKDYESIVVCTRSTQTPDDWAIVEAELNEDILMEIQNEIQQHMKNSNSNSMVKSSNIVPNFVTKIQENRLKPEDIALKPLTSRIPIKLEMRRIAKNRQEQKRASSPIHVNHNAAIPVGSRPLKSSPYGVTGTNGNNKFSSSDIMSSEGTSHGRNSQSPTPNTSNSNSVNSTPTKIITSNNPAINTQHQPIIIPNTRRVIGSQEALNQEVEAVFSRKEPFHSKTPPDGRRCPVPLCAAYCSPVLKPSSSPNGYAYNSGAAAATVNAQYFLYSDFGGRSPKRTTPVSSGSHSRQSSNTSVASTQTKEVAALMGSLNICENGSPRPASPMNNNNNCSPRYARNTSPVLFIKDREHIRRMVVREPPEGAEDRKNNNNASSSRSSSRNGKQQLLHPMHQPKPSYEPLNRYLNQSNVAASLQPPANSGVHLPSNLPSNLLSNHNNPSNLPKNCSSVTPTPQNTQQTCNCNTSPSQNQHVVATQHLQHCPLLNVPQTSSSRTNKHRTMSTTSSGYSTAAASSVASYSSFSSNYTGKTSSSGSSLFYPPPHQPGIKQKILPSRPDRRGGKNFNPCQANFKPRPQSTRYNNKPMTPVAGQGAACDANGFAINTTTPSQTPTIEQNSGNGYQGPNGYQSNGFSQSNISTGYQNNGYQINSGYQNSQTSNTTGSHQNSQQGFYPVVTSDYHSAYMQSINVTPAHYANYANNNHETNNTSLLRNSSSSTPQQEHSPPQPTES